MEEEQPLLPQELSLRDAEDGSFPPPSGQLSFSKVRNSGMGIADHIVAIFLPWFMFTTVVWLFIYIYHEHRWLVWTCIGAFFLVGLLLVAMGNGRSRSVHLAIGLLSLAAICVGSSIGIYLYDTYVSMYWQLQDGAEYINISPGSKASDHANATMIGFTPDAFVDTDRTLGYMEAGVVYCVAPVSSQKFSSAPQYWAAGRDCCDQRSHYQCGETINLQAKTGVLIQNENERPKYETAIRMAEAVYNLSPTETGRYALAWTPSDRNFKDDLWASCRNLFLLSSGLYLVCSVAAAFILRKSVQSMF